MTLVVKNVSRESEAEISQSKHSMDSWQKWTLAFSFGAQHAGGG